MKTPLHLFQLLSAPSQRDSESVHVVTRKDAPRATALFRAPSLPTRHQFNSELPFSVNFGPRLRERP